jgi:hypothetical protein
MKAQSALEYLMTYGWAILIVIIVGAALYALGVFNPGTFTGQKSTGFSAVQMDDFKFDTEGNVTLLIGNRRGRTIDIKNITAEYGANTLGNNTVGCLTTPLGPNEECTGSVGVFTPQPQGASYDMEITVKYVDSKTQVEHTDFGTISGSVEPV